MLIFQTRALITSLVKLRAKVLATLPSVLTRYLDRKQMIAEVLGPLSPIREAWMEWWAP